MSDPDQISLFEAAFPFHFVLDGDRRIVQVGPSLARAFPGLRVGDALEASFEILRPPRAFDRWDRHLDRGRTIWVLRGPDSGLRMRGQMFREGDERVYFAGSPWLEDLDALERSSLRLSDFAVHDASIDYVALMQGLNTSLADARELADRLALANRRAQEANAAKSQFLAVMSHEIRTPLNGVLGLLELLLDGSLPQEVRETLNVVHSSSRMLQVLLSDILDFSKIEAGRLTLEELELSPRDMVDEIRRLYAEMASKKGLNLEVILDPRLPERVLGDPTRLRQVLSNLVNNAIKFTESGEVVIALKLVPRQANTAGQEAFDWSIEVYDSGIGMDAETLARLFQPFVQADASTTRRYGGTGLGLSICQRLIELMGGRLSATSEPQRGSCFMAKLPLRSVEGFDLKPRMGVHLPADWLSHFESAFGDLGLQQVERSEADIWFQACENNPRLEGRQGGTKALGPAMDEPALGAWSFADWAQVLAPWLGLAPWDGGLPGAHETLSLESAAGDRIGRGTKEAEEGALGAGDLRISEPDPRDSELLSQGLSHSNVRLDGRARPCVLVADDTPTNRLVARKMLERLGYDAHLCETGAEVLERLDPQVHELVLMDFQMPGLDGFETTRLLRERLGDECPVILGFTANGMPEEHARAIEAGMSGIVSKPVQLESLRLALAPYLENDGGAGSEA